MADPTYAPDPFSVTPTGGTRGVQVAHVGCGWHTWGVGGTHGVGMRPLCSSVGGGGSG